MPATSEARIQANRKNAALSTGPKTESGKARSRANATKHGMAAALPEVEAALSTEFDQRRARWAEEHQPTGEAANWALDRAVAATFRIERCERAFDEVKARSQERARLAWDQDRAVEAAEIFGRLVKDPVLASRQLETTLAGVRLLLDAWFGLASILETGDWSEAEASRALDLLGVSPDLRSGRTPIDEVEAVDRVAFRVKLVFGEIDRLEALRDQAMVPLDEMGRNHAIEGEVALLSKPAQLVLRYERDAWRRHRESMKEVKSRTSEEGKPLEGQGSRCRVTVERPAEPGPKDQTGNHFPISQRSGCLVVRDSEPVRVVPDERHGFGVPNHVAPLSSDTDRGSCFRPDPKVMPEPVPQAPDESGPTFEDERRALQAAVAEIRSGVVDRLGLKTLEDQFAWLDEQERQGDLPATERTHFDGSTANPIGSWAGNW